MSQPAAQRQETGTLRRIIVLGAALGLYLALDALKIRSLGAVDSLTLASVGFVILASYSVGALVTKLGAPRVTGYILAGILLGPSAFEILSTRTVAEMSVFNGLALGLIALSAGLELHISSIRRLAGTLLRVVALKVPLLLIFVGGACFLFLSIWPVIELPSATHIAALSLILAVLGIGTSPAIALALISDTGAKGRLTELTLGLAIVKDVVVVIALAVAIAVAASLVSPDGSFDPAHLAHVGVELLSSIAAGAALGGLLILYLKFVDAEMLAFSVAVALLTFELSTALHLEFLLVCITAGFVVTNFSEYEHEMLDPIERVALPVFIVFFTTAGAKLDLQGTLAILPLALVLVSGRVVAYVLTGRLALGKETPEVQKNGWLTWIPQAGVTLGLVLIASEALPELADPIRSVGMALVAINLLVGPITMGIGLARSGETPQESEPELSSEETAEPTVAGPIPASVPGVSAEEPPIPLVAALGDPLDQLHADLVALMDAFVVQQIVPVAELERETAEGLLGAVQMDEGRFDELRRRLASAVTAGSTGWETALLDLYADSGTQMRKLHRRVTVPFDPALLEPKATDSTLTRLRRSGARIQHRLGRLPVRQVPVRAAARIALDRRLAETFREVLASRYRLTGDLLRRISGVVRGISTAESVQAEVAHAVDRWLEVTRADLRRSVSAGVREARRMIAIAGGPELAEDRVRYSTVEADVSAALAGVGEDAQGWHHTLESMLDTLRATVQVEACADELNRSLDTTALKPTERVVQAHEPILARIHERLIEFRADLAGRPLAEWGSLEELLLRCQGVWLREERVEARRARATFRMKSQPNVLLQAMVGVLWRELDKVRIVDPATPLSLAGRPTDVRSWELNLDDRLESHFVEMLVPAVAETMSPGTELVSGLAPRIRQALTVAAYGLEVAVKGEFDDDAARLETVNSSLTRAIAAIVELQAELAAVAESTAAELLRTRESSLLALRGHLSEDAGATGARVRTALDQVLRRLRSEWSRGVAYARARARALGLALQRLAGQRTIRDRRIRSGHDQLDAAGISGYVGDFLKRPTELGLPEVYARLFTPSPVTDRRLFVARKSALRDVSLELSDAGGGGPRAVLVTGSPGSGKSTLLNMVQLQLRGRRVVRMDAALVARRGIVAGLAAELGCAEAIQPIVDRLIKTRTVVLIDDLHIWLTPHLAGLKDVRLFSRILVECGDAVRWLVSIDQSAAAVLNDVMPLASTFTRVLDLAPLTWQELRGVVEQRQKLGGFKVLYAHRLPLLHRLPFIEVREEESYFKALRRATGGNVTEALLVHLWSLTPGPDDRLRAGSPIESTMPFLAQLEPAALGFLLLLVRFGPMSDRALSAILLEPPSEVARLGRFLEAASLVTRDTRLKGRYALPDRLAPSLVRGLRDIRALPETTS